MTCSHSYSMTEWSRTSIIFRNNRKEVVLERSIHIVHQFETMIPNRIHLAKEMQIEIL